MVQVSRQPGKKVNFIEEENIENDFPRCNKNVSRDKKKYCTELYIKMDIMGKDNVEPIKSIK